MKTMTDYIFLGSKIIEDGDCNHETKIFAPLKQSYDKPRQCNKKQRHHFGYKDLYRKAVIFSCSHVWMRELDHREDWVGRTDSFKLWCRRSLESPLDCKKIKPVNSKEKQPWMFNGRKDAEADAPVLWPTGVKSWLIGKDPDAEKDWRKKIAEDEKFR